MIGGDSAGYDERLRFSWENTLSPENHLYDYQNSSLTMKHLIKPLMQLHSKTVRLLASKSNLPANPFQAQIDASGKCKCIAPQSCDA